LVRATLRGTNLQSRKGGAVLADKPVAASVGVKDIAVARAFYEGTLGLSPMMEMPGGIVYRSGPGAILVYESQYAGTNEATAATWAVGDEFDAIVDDLREKGVTFERYDDLPDTTREGDVHSFGDLKSVWFKDPDGNILNIGNAAV
jgi:catechol 2,3-dioxygenase-like lactoylglutathione lyase family enzyme